MLSNLFENEILFAKQITKKLLTKRNVDLAITAFSLALGFYLDWNNSTIIMFGFLFWFILNPIQSKVLYQASIFFLLLIPILLVVGLEERAQQSALLAFFVLSLAFVKTFFELRKKKSA